MFVLHQFLIYSYYMIQFNEILSNNENRGVAILWKALLYMPWQYIFTRLTEILGKKFHILSVSLSIQCYIDIAKVLWLVYNISLTSQVAIVLNIHSRTTLQHLNTTLVYSFNLKCIAYKSKNNWILSFVNIWLYNHYTAKYYSVYIKLVPTQARHSDISDRHVIISMLMECWTIKKKNIKNDNHLVVNYLKC